MRKDGSWVKTQRLKKINNMIASTMPEGYDYEQFLVKVQYELGLSPNKAENYTEVVCSAKGWSIKDGRIVGE